jgi:hypothetical protein
VLVRFLLRVLCVLAVMLGAAHIRAQTPPASTAPPRIFVRLEYDRPASGCPSDFITRAMIFAAVRAWDPFVEAPSPWTIKLSVVRRPRGYEGTVELRDTDGRVQWSRSYPVIAACIDLVDDLASAVGFRINPHGLDAPVLAPAASKPPSMPVCASKPLPASEPSPCRDSRFSIWPDEWPLRPLRAPTPDPPKPLERWPVAVRIGVGAWTELIVKDFGSIGLSAEVGARYHFVSFGIEAHGDPPLGAAREHEVGAGSFARVSGALLVCAHYGFFAGCGVVDVGRFLFPNHLQPLPISAFYGAAGVRMKLEFPLVPPLLFLTAAVDLRAPILPASYTYRGAIAFASAGPSGGIGLGLLFELPPFRP